MLSLSCARFGVLPAALALGLAVGAASGQPELDAADRRPQAAQRIVKVFDFEEPDDGPLALPSGWFRAQEDPLVPRVRPGFPIWNRGSLDGSVSARGSGSVRLTARGGSASLRLRPGMVPIFPQGEYRVSAMVRCEELTHARPRLVVRALDRRGEPIGESQRSTVLERPAPEWQAIHVTLPGVFSEAAYLQIDLELVQPREYVERAPREHQVWREDFDAVAWFDEVAVTQVPQLHLSTDAPTNVITRPDGPALHVELRDLAAEHLTATIRVFDARRRLVDTSTRSITTGREAWSWSPALEELGWYRAVVDVASGPRLIASESTDFLWLEAPRARRTAVRTGPAFDGGRTRARPERAAGLALQLHTLPPGSPEELARAAAALGVRAVTLPLWEPHLRADDLPGRVDLLRETSQALRGHWIEPRLALPVLPEELAAALRMHPDHVGELFGAPPAQWEPYLLDALDRLGASTARWQIGRPGRTDLLAGEAGAEQLRAVRAHLARLVPGVELTLGWRADRPAGEAERLGIDIAGVLLPPWTADADLEALARSWRAAEAVRAEYVLGPLSTDRYTERDAAAELARRAVRLFAAADRRDGDEPAPFALALADPWASGADAGVELAVWRTLADQLGGRRFAAEWALRDGLRCFVFEPTDPEDERGGMIAAWREDAPDEHAELRASLGAHPVTLTDIMGNTRRIEPSEGGAEARSEHAVPLSAEPVFVEGIDTELVLFLRSLALEPPTIQALAGEQHHHVVAHNPWSVPVTGRIFIADPGGYDAQRQARDRSWEITPRSIDFDIPPGQSARLPIVVSISRAIEAGPQDFVFDVQLTASRDYGWVRTHSATEITWDDVILEVAYRRPEEGAGADLIVEAVVTNIGDRPRAFEAFAFAPGLPRARASIGSIEPGQTVVRYFPFSAAAASLAGQRVLVSIAEPDGPGRLTKGVDILGR